MPTPHSVQPAASCGRLVNYTCDRGGARDRGPRYKVACDSEETARDPNVITFAAACEAGGGKDLHARVEKAAISAGSDTDGTIGFRRIEEWDWPGSIKTDTPWVIRNGQATDHRTTSSEAKQFDISTTAGRSFDPRGTKNRIAGGMENLLDEDWRPVGIQRTATDPEDVLDSEPSDSEGVRSEGEETSMKGNRSL